MKNAQLGSCDATSRTCARRCLRCLVPHLRRVPRRNDRRRSESFHGACCNINSFNMTDRPYTTSRDWNCFAGMLAIVGSMLGSSLGSWGCQSITPTAPTPHAAEPLCADACIEFQLDGIRTDDGVGPILIALWANEQTFLQDGKWIRGITLTPTEAAGKPVISGLVAGTYAVSAFQDTTNCGALRRGAFGIPLDPWAFSNGGAAMLPPSWKRASFEVRAGTTRIVLDFTHKSASPSLQPKAAKP